MKRRFIMFATCLGLMAAAKSAESTSGETLGGSSGSAVDAFESLASVKAGLSFGFGEHAMARLVDTQAMFIRHTATKLQRQIAEQNAKAYFAHLAPEKKIALKTKKVRYIAVPTVRSKETAPEAKEVLMIWDIPRETLVGKNVYELGTTPQIGKLASYDNLVAEYVGKPTKDY